MKEEVICDFLGSLGLVNACKLAIRVRQGGLMAFGLPCNSHSFMSSSIHRRSEENPFGDEFQSLVVCGNILGYRTALLICLALVKRVAWLLENPGNSRCLHLPVFQKLLQASALLGTQTVNWWGLQCFQQ